MSFYKAYDMRGEFGRDFDLDTVYRIGRWLPHLLDAKRILVGRDVRLTSAAMRTELCRGLLESGCDVDDMGVTTTPMVYFFTASDNYDGSVQITASHNPASHNGLKVSRQGALPVGYTSGLAELEQHVNSGELPEPAKISGKYQEVEGRQRFVDWLRSYACDFTGLRFAVDCSNGVVGLLAEELFGSDALYLNEQLDGNFPGHSPNPLDPTARVALQQAVVGGQLDVGVIFDGDADRVMFLDERGEFVQPDYLIPLLARQFLPKEPGATVICDIRTSRGVFDVLRQDGARAVMGKVGHAFAKVLMRETGAVCGGELAGHYYFRDFFNCDSGELAALLILNAVAEAKKVGITFSELVAPVMCYANSGERNYLVADQDEAIAVLLKNAAAYGEPVSKVDFDGIRLEFEDWWFNVRKSNTEPYLRVIVEADTKLLLEERLGSIESILAPWLQTGSNKKEF